VNEYRLALLVLALPLLLTFLTWSVLHWRRQRRRGPSASLPGGTGSV
jgi:preprotein translocase subunit YajC